jgi:hypothetical protein
MQQLSQTSWAKSDIHWSFSQQTQISIYHYLESLDLSAAPIKDWTFSLDQLTHLRHDLHECMPLLQSGPRLLMIRPFHHTPKPLNLLQQRALGFLLATMIGEPQIQNDQGDTIISVYDRDHFKTMSQGARYHQTREGGSIHTDNVNTPDRWDYMVLNCLQNSTIGGENIFVSALEIHQVLKKDFPHILRILERPFLWECRGISDKHYEAPIITYNDQGEPLFRYLRPYMEAAHKKWQQPLSFEQIYALDCLDSLMECSPLQKRHFFQPGEILLAYDAQVLHGRTSFCDDLEARCIDEVIKNPALPLKRTLDRIWCKKRTIQ